MLIAVSESEGSEPALVIVGLSYESLSRLLGGKPIVIKKHKAIPNMTLAIMVGKDDQTIRDDIVKRGGVEKHNMLSKEEQ